MDGEVLSQLAMAAIVDSARRLCRELRPNVNSENGRSPALQRVGDHGVLGRWAEMLQRTVTGGDTGEATLLVYVQQNRPVSAKQPIDPSDPSDDIAGRGKQRRGAGVQRAGQASHHRPS